MRKLKASGMSALTAFILFLLPSLFSWSVSDRNWLSKIIFWGPTVILSVWTTMSLTILFTGVKNDLKHKLIINTLTII